MRRLSLRYFVIAVAAVLGIATARGAVRVEFVGTDHQVVQVTPDKNTGLDAIYVAYSLDGVGVMCSGVASSAKWYEYSGLGGGYAREVDGVERVSATELYLPQVSGDMGYIVESADERVCFWVVDYSAHKLELSGLTLPSASDCGMVELGVEGDGAPIRYTTIHGQSRVLDRELQLSYYTLEWDNEAKQYQQVEQTDDLESFSGNVWVNPAPLCNTTFSLSGDRFLRAWGLEESVESGVYVTSAVEVHTWAEQESQGDEDSKSNQITQGGADSGSLGGSAPAEVTFYASCSDAVIHYEWQFARDEDFENPLYRFTERDLNYVFREEGTFYVRFVGSNADGSCEAYGDVYTVSIGTPELRCPNAFSPGASEGVNDEWKVSYRSIVDFECWIFNRHGQELFHFTDPSQGWDGRHRGKLVKPGVYYYVIQATGADGKKYNRSGDINIIRYKTYGSSGVGGGDDPVSE